MGPLAYFLMVSDVESEEHDVAVRHFVRLALHAELPGVFERFLAAVLEQVLDVVDLSTG